LPLIVATVLLVSVESLVPVLEGYNYSVKVTNYLSSDVNVPTMYMYTDTAPGIARVGLVYNTYLGLNISQIWVAVGWTTSCQMLDINQPSDAVVMWMDQNNVVHLADFYLYARQVPTTISCQTTNTSICADTSKPASFGCSNNANLVYSNVTDDGFVIIEFTRPLAASDMCDIPVVTGKSICMLASTGTFQDPSADLFPDNIDKHLLHVANPYDFNITWPIPPVSTTASTTAMPTTTGSVSGATGTTAPATTTGVLSTTAGPSSATTGSQTSGSSTTATVSTTAGSTTGPVDCTNLAQKCEENCGSLKVKLCRCVNNQPSVECAAESKGSVTSVFSFAIICLALMFVW